MELVLVRKKWVCFINRMHRDRFPKLLMNTNYLDQKESSDDC